MEKPNSVNPEEKPSLENVAAGDDQKASCSANSIIPSPLRSMRCKPCQICTILLVIAAVIALFNRLGPYHQMVDRSIPLLILGALPTILLAITGLVVIGVVFRSLGVAKWFILALLLALFSQGLGITDEISFSSSTPILGAQGQFHREAKVIAEVGAYCIFFLALYRALFILYELTISSKQQTGDLQQEIKLRTKTQGELLKEKDEAQWLAGKIADLHVFAKLLAKTGSVEELCRNAVWLGRQQLEVDRLSIWLTNDGGGLFTGTFGIDESGNLCDEREKTYELNPLEDARKIEARRMAPVVILKNRTVQNDRQEVVRTSDLAVVSLWNGEELIGELSADMLLSGKPISQPVTQLLRIFGDDFGHLLTRQRLEDSLRQSQRIEHRLLKVLSDLHKVTMELTSAETTDALCRRAIESCRRQLGFHRVQIWLQDEDSGCLQGTFQIDEKGMVHDICDQTLDPASLYQTTDEERSNEQVPASVFALSDGFYPMVGIDGKKTWRTVLPLSSMGKSLGMMVVDFLFSNQTWTQAEVDTSLLVGETISSLLYNRLQEDQRRKWAAQMTQMQRFESLGILAGGIAHDFNNILGAIIGYTELVLADLPEGSPLYDMQEQILRAAKRATELVKQILSYSRKSIGKQGETIQPHLVVKEVSKLLRATIPSTIQIRTNIRDDCGSVAAQATHIHQIVMNLCTNAYHAMKDQGEVLEITLNAVDLQEQAVDLHLPPGKYIQLTVRDEGEGMDPETLKKACEPFFTTKEPGKGTGLGLSTVRGIATSLGGTLTLSSTPGKGTVVQVLLPQCAQSTSTETKQARSESVIQTAKRILVVDDEADIVMIIREYLKRIGQHVTGTTSPIEALEILQAEPGFYDLLITDQTMPQMTGLRLSRSTHKIQPDLPIILITGDSNPPIDIEHASLENIQAILQKPVTRSVLYECLTKVFSVATTGHPTGAPSPAISS